MTTFVSVLYVPSRFSRFRSRFGEKQCKCRRHCAVHRTANYPAVFREGDDSSVALIHTHILTKRVREGDTEGVEADGGRSGMRRNRGGMCYLWTRVRDPSSYPMVGGGPSISHCYTARRWVEGSHHSRTFDFKRYPFSFYYLPSSSAHRATPTDDARIILALARATLQCISRTASSQFRDGDLDVNWGTTPASRLVID